MSGAGYDYSAGTYSPDGRIFQIEYAQKAVDNSSTAIGIKCSDGVVIAIGKNQASPMLVSGSNRRVFPVEQNVGIVVTGYAADGRQIVNRAREEAQNYKDTYGHKVLPSVLSNRLALYVHYFTLYGSLRPFGTSSIVAAFDEDLQSHELYMIEPSGVSFRYFGCAAGKGTNAAKTELEKILNKYGNAGLTCKDAVFALAKILHLIRDPAKDKELELEMGWICHDSKNVFSHVPKDLVAEADAKGKAEVEKEGGPIGAAITAQAEEEEKQAEEKAMDVEEEPTEEPVQQDA